MFEAVPKKTKDSTQSPVLTGLAYCDRLFDIERELVDLSADERRQKRLELERPFLDAFNIRLYLETVITKMLDYKMSPKAFLETLCQVL